MKVLVVEDEPLAAERLTDLIGQVDEDISVVKHLDTVRDTVSYLSDDPKHIDLIFCDIQLADGLSFEIFRKVKPAIPVVFTTAYDEYALKAFETNSIDYLLKPLKLDKLQNAVF